MLTKNKILVTGGAGFIGSHLVDRLIEKGNKVTVFDNISSGKLQFIEHHLENPDFTLIKGDLLDQEAIEAACRDIDIVCHVAANPDVRLGATDTRAHLEQNILATYNLLEAMRKNSVKEIAFTSTSTVYGEASIMPTPEDYGPLIPISLYGASKLACEALITSYSHTFDMRAWIFRFANIVGPRSTHGITIDFIKKLEKNPNVLEVLGDGKQEKSYLHVSECVDAIIFLIEKSREKVNIFNIGSEDTISATEIGKIVIEEMGLSDVKFVYTGGSRGWKGDVPKMRLGIEKMKALGWKPVYSSERSVRETARALLGERLMQYP
ncbi:UDP-glucose 4-epimerase [Methanosarcina thermophila]|jgi:UDP-glucose 4-epimerase|uniref:UDP-glucose 4-epimerase n=3 Tax=Methanosarcina thermophila TaxID=2210 RepID=A0A1I6X227_METTE|nr:NAD-dependent epimerase/dehydratase family protein [Methanosarcina thermophila]ALK04751.1 MAG: UDP-glucose 4-epimerase [Methanosarcina sp. 795]AKB13456.1 UDP-glucose 4-epimerase [Methanosarcina thermophila TM-1]AKB15908.1 UDP-glucose 4-epimerase [Methanosarcina thermophila CHTI-55]NLU56533.1 SDR family NAD(P)-dependent oxidoreductase [Methanosarcina thermophila]SFT32343.1 UDP-glucose 4-epimerase [Methanosarcina thermophila]